MQQQCNKQTNANYQVKDSSMKSMLATSTFRRTAALTESDIEPPPQTVTPMVPARVGNSASSSVSKFGRPGCICTLAEGLMVSTALFGRVTKRRILRTSLLLGIARITSIHGRTHSNCSLSLTDHIKTIFLVATVCSA